MRKSSFKPLVSLALVFLAIPDFAVIDILPDFISYIILFTLIGKSRSIIPHLAEAYDGLKRLAFMSLIKIPAMLLMLSSIRLGTDIIPLMTFTFSAIELILLIPTIKSAFKGLNYIGERTEVHELLEPVRLGEIYLGSEKIETLCYSFFVVKYGLNTISQLFLLSSASESTTLKFRQIYPVLTIISLALTMICGVIMLIIVGKYAGNIFKNSSFGDEIMRLMTPEQKQSIEYDKRLASLIKPLDLFVISQIFTLDITLNNFGEYNILPRFIFPILIFVVAFKLFDKRWQILNLLGASAYAIASCVEFFVSFDFYNRFTSIQLINDTTAQNAYKNVINVNVIELLFAIPMLILFFIGICKFIRSKTAVAPNTDGYNNLDRETHSRLSFYFGIILGGDLLIFALKCLDAILKSDISPLFTEVTGSIVAVSSAPWLAALTFGVSIILIFLTYYFIGRVKEEVKLKLEK